MDALAQAFLRDASPRLRLARRLPRVPEEEEEDEEDEGVADVEHACIAAGPGHADERIAFLEGALVSGEVSSRFKSRWTELTHAHPLAPAAVSAWAPLHPLHCLLLSDEDGPVDSDGAPVLSSRERSEAPHASSRLGSSHPAKRRLPARCFFALKRCAGCCVLACCPASHWLPSVTFGSLRADVVAGVTVGIMLVPQSMSYAAIAGLPYRYGLYSSLTPLFVYALYGSSPQLQVGPVAMVSLLVELGLSQLISPEACVTSDGEAASAGGATVEHATSEQSACLLEARAALASQLALVVGFVQLCAGFLRLGFLVSFLAHAVISGFTSAAGLVIGLSQLPHILGCAVPKSPNVLITLAEIAKRLPHSNAATLSLGVSWCSGLAIARLLARRCPRRCSWLRPTAPLLACVIGSLIAANTKLLDQPSGGPSLIVGHIPATLPEVKLPADLSAHALWRALPTAVSASLIGYMESIAVAKSLAAKHHADVHPSQELVALGLANAVGGLCSAYPIAGSFSRSAVNDATGAATNLAGGLTAALVLLTLTCLTSWFYFLPKFCLAAIVITSVASLVDFAEARYLLRVKRSDFGLWLAAFVGTLVLGVERGIVLAVVSSLLLIIVESARPQVAVLWYAASSSTPDFVNVKLRDGRLVEGVLVARLGASMYFANVSFVRERLAALLALDKQLPPIEYLVLEMTACVTVDSAAVHSLFLFRRELEERGIVLVFAAVGNRVDRVLRRAGFVEAAGEDHFQHSVLAAVRFCLRQREQSRRSLPNGGDVAVVAQSSIAVEAAGYPAYPAYDV